MGGRFAAREDVDSDSDEGERDRFEGDVILADTSAHVMRMWLHEASKRTGGGRMARRLRDCPKLQTATWTRDPSGHRRKLSPEAQALAKGWLAAVKAVRAARGDRPAGLSSSDTDTDGGGLRRQWGTPVVSPASAALVRDWLQRARKKVGETPKAAG